MNCNLLVDSPALVLLIYSQYGTEPHILTATHTRWSAGLVTSSSCAWLSIISSSCGWVSTDIGLELRVAQAVASASCLWLIGEVNSCRTVHRLLKTYKTHDSSNIVGFFLRPHGLLAGCPHQHSICLAKFCQCLNWKFLECCLGDNLAFK